MEYLKEPKKKHKKLKIFGIIFVVVIILTLAFTYSQYKRNYSSGEQNLQLVDSDGSSISLDSLEKTDVGGDPNQELYGNVLSYYEDKYHFANPSSLFWREGVLVAYIDHAGTMMGVGNITFTDSETRGNGYGFFDYLGDQTTRIAKGFFTNISATGDVYTGNLTITGTNFSMGGCSEYWNGSCSIKYCPTTTTITC